MGDRASVQTFITDFARDFREKYRYRIRGREDSLFEKVVTIDKKSYDKLRRVRTSEARAIQNIEDTETDASTRLVRTAEAKLRFLRESTKVVQGIEKTKKPDLVTDVVEALANELRLALDNYTSGRQGQSGGLNAGQDTKFLSEVRYLENKLDRIAFRQKSRLRENNIFFDIDYRKSRQMFKQIDQTITNLDILV